MKYIALDIGNVCIQIDHVSCYSKVGFDGMPPQEVMLLAQDYECGRLTEDEFWTRFQQYAPDKSKSRQDLEKDFDSILVEPVEGMEELISSLPLFGIQPVFFSDVSARHMKLVRRMFRASAMVPHGIYSFEVGAMKPADAMFEAFEKRFGVPALYVDDRAVLIEAAKKRGWNAIVFTDAKALARALQNC
jgi:putative hydrolase of the HAD superfamily